jgi:uncharacterized protein YjiS (DUF1127 family)
MSLAALEPEGSALGSPVHTPVLQALRRMVGACARWYRIRSDARTLYAMPDYMLKDLGITRGDIRNVVANPGAADALRTSRRRR